VVTGFGNGWCAEVSPGRPVDCVYAPWKDEIARTNIKWVAQVSLLGKLACRRQEKDEKNGLLGSIPPPIDGCPMRLPRVKASVLPAVSAPILRVLCEGWDSQISPFNLPPKADLVPFETRVFRLGPSARRNPGRLAVTRNRCRDICRRAAGNLAALRAHRKPQSSPTPRRLSRMCRRRNHSVRGVRPAGVEPAPKLHHWPL
jgi:hypothetical protein